MKKDSAAAGPIQEINFISPNPHLLNALRNDYEVNSTIQYLSSKVTSAYEITEQQRGNFNPHQHFIIIDSPGRNLTEPLDQHTEVKAEAEKKGAKVLIITMPLSSLNCQIAYVKKIIIDYFQCVFEK